MKKLDIVRASSLFAGLTDEVAAAVGNLAVVENYRKGETIFFEGDEADGFYIVGSGTVKVFKISPSGKEHILHIFGSGEPVGEVPVFSNRPFPASAEALVKSTMLYIPRKEFVLLIEQNPSVAMNMLAVLSMRLRQFTNQIENLSLKEVPARLAGYLLYMLDEQENDAVVELPVSKGQLASLLGTIPETLSRIFSKMSEEGLISVDGRSIRILDRDGLGER